MQKPQFLRDPTSEASTTLRKPTCFPENIEKRTIALLDIAKERSNEFLDHIESKFTEKGIGVRRYRKASNSKNADLHIIQSIVREADIVIESLAD